MFYPIKKKNYMGVREREKERKNQLLFTNK